MSKIEIEDGYQLKVDGALAGSLEDALANFPKLDKQLWAALHLELKSCKKDIATAQAKVAELELQIPPLVVTPLVVTPPVLTEEEKIAAEVTRRLAEKAEAAINDAREIEIERRIALAT